MGFARYRPRDLALALLWSAALLPAAACEGSDTARGPIRFEHVPGAFKGDAGPQSHPPFDLVATDMDLDGDTDLLINWHRFGPLELFANEGGVFRRVNLPATGFSGLHDARDIPGLFADRSEMSAKIERLGQPGLYLWHDADRGGSWRFLWSNAERRYAGLVLDLETSLGVEEIEGLQEAEVERLDARRLRLSIPEEAVGRAFRIRTERLGVQLKLHLAPDASGETPSLFAGAELVRWPGGTLSVWKPDPHGIAWVDVEGTRRPDLYVTRGGLAGALAPPLDPKVDRYYVDGGGAGSLYRAAPAGAVPSGYGRGRRVEWVDVDNDGSLDLSIANKRTPNVLLFRDPQSGLFRDRAGELGLDFRGAEVQAWADFDGDGWEDLFFLEGNAVHVARNVEGARFERIEGPSLGLVLPPAGNRRRLIETTALRLADFDNDGDLDLWVFAYGRSRTNHLFRRDRDGFIEISAVVGLGRVSKTRTAVLLDVDNDSFEDVISFGAATLLWRNLAGQGFEIAELPGDLVHERIHAAAICDADGDGRTDLVLAGKKRHLLRNLSGEGNSFLDVDVRSRGGEPIGALVLARYGNGAVVARRYGSVHSSAFSQALQPLRFGVPQGVRLERVGVRWPGEREETLYEISEPGGRITLSR